DVAGEQVGEQLGAPHGRAAQPVAHHDLEHHEQDHRQHADGQDAPEPLVGQADAARDRLQPSHGRPPRIMMPRLRAGGRRGSRGASWPEGCAAEAQSGRALRPTPSRPGRDAAPLALQMSCGRWSGVSLVERMMSSARLVYSSSPASSFSSSGVIARMVSMSSSGRRAMVTPASRMVWIAWALAVVEVAARSIANTRVASTMACCRSSGSWFQASMLMNMSSMSYEISDGPV